jgi:hypothetical protein
MQFEPSIVVDTKNKAIRIILEDCPFYAEWIPGEGGDISLYKSIHGDRVVGAFLPLNQWNGKLPVTII